MSKKLKQAIMSGTVKVRSTQAGEVSIWFRDRDGVRRTVTVGGFNTVELAPKLTTAEHLNWSNIEALVRARAIAIV